MDKPSLEDQINAMRALVRRTIELENLSASMGNRLLVSEALIKEKACFEAILEGLQKQVVVNNGQDDWRSALPQFATELPT